MRRPIACAASYVEEEIQDRKDIGRSFEAYKSSEGAGYKPETIERAPNICRAMQTVSNKCHGGCKREISLPSPAWASGRSQWQNKQNSECICICAAAYETALRSLSVPKHMRQPRRTSSKAVNNTYGSQHVNPSSRFSRHLTANQVEK